MAQGKDDNGLSSAFGDHNPTIIIISFIRNQGAGVHEENKQKNTNRKTNTNCNIITIKTLYKLIIKVQICKGT